MKLNKVDKINCLAIVVSVIAFILTFVGGQVLSYTTAIGFNLTHLHPVLFIGIGLAVVGMVIAGYGAALCFKHENNRKIAVVALYLAEIVLMFSILFLVWTIVWPVLFPVNG